MIISVVYQSGFGIFSVPLEHLLRNATKKARQDGEAATGVSSLDSAWPPWLILRS